MPWTFEFLAHELTSNTIGPFERGNTWPDSRNQLLRNWHLLAFWLFCFFSNSIFILLNAGNGIAVSYKMFQNKFNVFLEGIFSQTVSNFHFPPSLPSSIAFFLHTQGWLYTSQTSSHAAFCCVIYSLYLHHSKYQKEAKNWNLIAKTKY